MRTLSKSDFKLARTCDAKLYFRENRYPDDRGMDAYLALLAQGGYMVEALAKARRGDGIQLEYGGDPAKDSATALAHLQQDGVRLFEATLLSGRRLARADIIERHGNELHLIEVKAKSFDTAEHAALQEAGKPGVFRKKDGGIISGWIDYFEDITFQALILEQLMPGFKVRPSLLLVDKSKRSSVDYIPGLFEIINRADRDGVQRLHTARYIGDAEQLAQLDLLAEVDASSEVEFLRDEVEAAACAFEQMLDQPFNPGWGERGAKCNGCEFSLPNADGHSGFDQCWGEHAHTSPHVLDLFSVGTVNAARGLSLVEWMLADRNSASLLDVPEEYLVKKDGSVGPNAARQRRQIEHARTGNAWVPPTLRRNVEGITYPLHFVDFEASRLALPYHAKMRCYGQVAFQWSCHTVAAPGAHPVHREWLNAEDIWPNRTFAQELRAAIGDHGSVLTWSGFEESALRNFIREQENFGAVDLELTAWINDLVANRIVDLLKWARDDFYHPCMGGRTSLKVVLDGLWKADAAMRTQCEGWLGRPMSESIGPYEALPPLEINGVPQDVREGTGAIRAYEAMMYGCEKNDVETKAQWSQLLREYCKLDTLSMVLVFEYWRRVTR